LDRSLINGSSKWLEKQLLNKHNLVVDTPNLGTVQGKGSNKKKESESPVWIHERNKKTRTRERPFSDFLLRVDRGRTQTAGSGSYRDLPLLANPPARRWLHEGNVLILFTWLRKELEKNMFCYT
jgi:hypothetical protein